MPKMSRWEGRAGLKELRGAGRACQLFVVMAIELARAAIGSWIPKMPLSCVNTASKPPVVLVSVVANKSRMICPAT